MSAHQAERGIALLRIVVGFWVLRSALSHLIWTPWPWAADYWVQFTTTVLARHSLDHPSFWVRYFIQQALLPNAEAYAGITVVLELLTGISLMFGLLTVPGGVVAAVLALIAGLLTHYQGDLYLGYHLLLGALALVFAITRAGRRWGFDAFLAGMRSRSVLW